MRHANITLNTLSSDKSTKTEDNETQETKPIKTSGAKSKVSELYEFCQAYHLGSPIPVDVFPPDRGSPSTHYIAYEVDGERFGIGSGKNKKAAREEAAKLALDDLQTKNEGL